MEFFAALAFGWVEWVAFTLFFIFMIVGTSFDRRGEESPKWYALGLGLAIGCAYYWKDLTSISWGSLATWEFWKPFAIYFAAGLVYSLVEFFLDIRRSARQYSETWAKHLKTKLSVPELDDLGNVQMVTSTDKHGFPNQKFNSSGELVDDVRPKMRETDLAEFYSIVKQQGPASAKFNKVNEETKQFIALNNSTYGGKIIGLSLAEDKISVDVKVVRAELAEHIGAWTFLWPAYFVSLIIGDLLTEVFRSIADFLTHISGRFVKLSFANVFKF